MTVVTTILAVIAFALVLNAFYIQIKDTYEDVTYKIFPSAERAYALGEEHFNGQNSKEYDIERAEYYFMEALKLDPSITYVHHELARIFFLRGDFVDAMTQINSQIAQHGDKTVNSYYVRGLIEGYMGNYRDSAKDYERFLKSDPHNWAAINDYSWVLLKAGRAQDAKVATEEGLKYFPNNAWLLNSNSIARYELGDLKGAQEKAQHAWAQVQKVSEAQWLRSYPGNDPAVAGQGIETFKKAVADNMHSIDAAIASSTVQSK
jgi:tetratricopeptide (TPR) repeat protein